MSRVLLSCIFMLALVYAVSSQTTRARFPGGDRAFAIYWDRQFKIPLKYRLNPPKVEGIIRLDISETGVIQQVQIIQSLNPELDQSAIAAVRSMPAWEPARQDGLAVPSSMEFAFFVLLERQGFDPVTWEEKWQSAKQGGLYMNVWLGAMVHTRQWGDYFNPLRPSLGLEFGYRHKKLSLGFGWDVLAVSRVRKPFLLDNVDIQTDDRATPFYLYFPITYWPETQRKWMIAPMIVPGIQYLILNRQLGGNNTQPEEIASASIPTLGAGFYLSKRVSTRAAYHPTKQKVRYESTYLGARCLVNLMALNKKNATPMRGAAISVNFSMNGWLQAGKKVQQPQRFINE